MSLACLHMSARMAGRASTEGSPDDDAMTLLSLWANEHQHRVEYECNQVGLQDEEKKVLNASREGHAVFACRMQTSSLFF